MGGRRVLREGKLSRSAVSQRHSGIVLDPEEVEAAHRDKFHAAFNTGGFEGLLVGTREREKSNGVKSGDDGGMSTDYKFPAIHLARSVAVWAGALSCVKENSRALL